VPVLTRRSTAWAVIAAAIVVTLLLAVGAALISVLVGQSCSGGTGTGDTPSKLAKRDIPADSLRIYEQVGAKYKIPWEILAGIGTEECDNGQFPRPRARRSPEHADPGWRTSRAHPDRWRSALEARPGMRMTRCVTICQTPHWAPTIRPPLWNSRRWC
jgi:hypothetical protein